MQNSSESLFGELNRLKAIFPTLCELLDDAVSQFRTSWIALPENLFSELTDFTRRVRVLGERILALGKELSLSKDQLVDPSGATLEALERSLHIIAVIEEQRTLQTNALGILDRISCIVRRDRSEFPPLLECQAQVRKLRDSIIKFPGTELHPAAKELAAGTHSTSTLLRFVESQNDLSDDEWLRFSKVVAESFGKELALAATRGKLEVLPHEEKTS